MKKIYAVIISLLLILSLTACQAASLAAETSAAQSADISYTTTAITETTTAAVSSAGTVAEALAENNSAGADAADETWDSAQVVSIQLNEDSISTDGAGVTVDGATATITAAGTYSLNGSLSNGQILVDTQDEGVVRLVFNGVDLHSGTGAPVHVISADKVVIFLAENSLNQVTDAETYTLSDPESGEPNAAVFSASDLTITGSGSLTVNGNSNDGIASKDDLILAGGSITVTAVDDGIRGKDTVLVRGGDITINALGDGLKADNEEDAEKGYIAIEGGTLEITSGGDAIQAETDVLVSGGEITLNAGGGSAARIDATSSAKGITAAVSVVIDGGTFNLDSADDALHSNGSIIINGGSFNIASADDGMHADATLTINNGTINITASYEGLESAVITLNGGEIGVTASDDGINVAGGNDGSGMMQPGMGGSGGRQMKGGGQMPAGSAGLDAFTSTGDYTLYVNGGTIMVDATGDGVDVNGAIEMTGGVLLVNGPTENMNGALDYDGSFNITGGYFTAAGSAGMAMAPGESSSQNSLLVNFSAVQPAGTLVHIQNSAGEDILTFAPAREFQSVAFSSPALASGETYTITLGGSSTGAAMGSLYQGGVTSGGTPYGEFTISSVVTRLGSSGMR